MSGERVADAALATRVPILVQIENNPLARPPSGLNLADLVIESPVEGDTTRYSAVFMCREKLGAAVGPVRSARYFNIDYWQQLRVATFHFGGAFMVLQRFRAAGMPFFNGLTSGSNLFFRSGTRPAPHNVFLDVDRARRQLESGALTRLAERAGDVRAPFSFADEPRLPKGRAVTSVGIQTASFWRFGWHWDAEGSRWLRTDAGRANFDATSGKRLSARTVVVQVVKEDVLVGENDPGGFPRRYQHLVGEGAGRVYIAGMGRDVRWSRPSADDATTWTYADSGAPLVLPRGRVWWEIVPVGTTITED
jgi:hypothetical protein